jgi:hypothetical protein
LPPGFLSDPYHLSLIPVLGFPRWDFRVGLSVRIRH